MWFVDPWFDCCLANRSWMEKSIAFDYVNVRLEECCLHTIQEESWRHACSSCADGSKQHSLLNTSGSTFTAHLAYRQGCCARASCGPHLGGGRMAGINSLLSYVTRETSEMLALSRKLTTTFITRPSIQRHFSTLWDRRNNLLKLLYIYVLDKERRSATPTSGSHLVRTKAKFTLVIRMQQVDWPSAAVVPLIWLVAAFQALSQHWARSYRYHYLCYRTR